MAVRKQRATTQKLYAMGEYMPCLKEAKQIHKYDKEFYMYRVKEDTWSSVSVNDGTTDLSRMDEHWRQNELTNRWYKDKK